MQRMAIVFDEQTPPAPAEPLMEEKGETGEELADLRLEVLKERLKEAVKDENYELATRLRDEINRRENKS